MSPTLYHVPKTISSPIYQIIIELGLTRDDSSIKVETLSFHDLKSSKHLARNPMGTSPTLTDEENGFAIWESGGVLSYILMTYDTTYRFHPNPATSSKADLAKFLHLQQYIIATVYPFLASLFIHTLKPASEQDTAYIEEAGEKFNTLLGPVLRDFLGNRPFFMGDEESAIDYLVAKPLNNASALGLLTNFPTLETLFQKIKCKGSFSTAYMVDVEDACNCRMLRLVPGD